MQTIDEVVLSEARAEANRSIENGACEPEDVAADIVQRLYDVYGVRPHPRD